MDPPSITLSEQTFCYLPTMLSGTVTLSEKRRHICQPGQSRAVFFFAKEQKINVHLPSASVWGRINAPQGGGPGTELNNEGLWSCQGHAAGRETLSGSPAARAGLVPGSSAGYRSARGLGDQRRRWPVPRRPRRGGGRVVAAAGVLDARPLGGVLVAEVEVTSRAE